MLENWYQLFAHELKTYLFNVHYARKKLVKIMGEITEVGYTFVTIRSPKL
jgi:hypothetical protein